MRREKAFLTRHVFVKHRCPRRQQSQTMAKISKSYILSPPHPQGHVMSVKCEQPLDELTVQVWLLYDHPNFKYCTLFISGTELRTDKQTDGRTDDPNTRCPRRTFQAGGIKTFTKTRMAAFQGMHVLPANHSYVWLPRKCDYRTDTQAPEKVIPMCCYASQAKELAELTIYTTIYYRSCGKNNTILS